MHAWALDKIQRELPAVSQAQASFLLRAEARTVNAVLNAKSTSQLQEVITAAKRRADIMQGEAMPTSASTSTTASTVEQVIATQQLIVNQLTQIQACQVNKDDFTQLCQTMQIQQALHMQHVQQLLARIQELENKIASWKDIMPHMTEPSPTPVYSELAEEERNAPTPPLHDCPQPSLPAPPGMVDLVTSSPELDKPESSVGVILKHFEEKSLQNQCQKAVGKATQPFKSSRS